jgi:hypothetical protein
LNKVNAEATRHRAEVMEQNEKGRSGKPERPTLPNEMFV